MSKPSFNEPWSEGRRHWIIATVIALVGVVIAAASLYQDYRNSHHDETVGSSSEEPPADSAIDGWGPDRPTFTMNNPPQYAVLNSITDDPSLGDERNFTRVRIVGTDEKYEDMVRADIGDVVSIFVGVHNNCANELAGPASTIHGLYMRYVPQIHGKDLAFQVFVGGQNVMTVYNGASVIVGVDAHLEMILGSARMLTNSTGEAGFAIDADAISRGSNVLLGETAPDGQYPTGRIPGTENSDYGAGYVEFQARVVRGA